MFPDTRSIDLRGVTAVLDPLGAAYLPAQRTLLFADLHFEKGSHFAARGGSLLPPFDTRMTLGFVATLIARYQPRQVISLGDAFHDRRAEHRMDESDAAHLSAMVDTVDWVWVLGNHDPDAPTRFGGTVRQTMALGELQLCHEPGEIAGWSVAGHLHPCAVVVNDGCRVRRPCFVTDGSRLVLPALGAYTGGLNVLDPAIADLWADEAGAQVFICGKTSVYAVPGDVLRPDRVARSVYQAAKATA